MAQAQPVDIPPPPTGVSQAELDAMWTQLLAGANDAKLTFMQRHTPAELQPHLAAYIANELEGPPPDPTQATVTNDDNVPVWASPSGMLLPGGPAKAVVVNSVLTRVDMPIATTTALVNNGSNVPVQDAAGAAVAGSPGTATVASHSLSNVKLTV
jgi:hypothetical protein